MCCIGCLIYGAYFFKWAFIVLAIFCSHCYADSLIRQKVKKQLASLPEQDREDLRNFFEELVIRYPFGYTIFGEKPISFATYKVSNLHKKMSMHTIHLIDGKKLWKKYSCLFPSHGFVFKFEYSLEDDCHRIYLINRKAVQEIVQQELDLFQQVLGTTVTPERLLFKIECPETTIQDVLQGHEGLFGILLGFGRESSLAFHQKGEVLKNIQYTLCHPENFSEEKCSLLEEYAFFFWNKKNRKTRANLSHEAVSLDVLIDALIDKEKSLSAFEREDNCLAPISLPDFVTLQNSKKTEALLHRYEQTQHLLAQIYANDSILEDALCKLVAK
jgi:hypothetical protein